MPFQPVSAGEVWVGTISFEVLVLARRRRLDDVSRDEVSSAVTTVLGMRGLQLGDETLSVTAAALAALDDGRQRFVLTVMALGPYMQRISELVRELDFRDEVESELSATVTVGKPGEVTFTTQLAASLSPPNHRQEGHWYWPARRRCVVRDREEPGTERREIPLQLSVSRT